MPTLPAPVSSGHRKTFRPVWILSLTTILALALCGCGGGASAAKTDAPGGGGSGKGGGRGRGGDVPVTVANASKRDVPVEIQVIGNVEAYSTITVKAQVGGQLVTSISRKAISSKRATSSSTSTRARWRPPTTRWWPTLPATAPPCFRRRPIWRAMRPTPSTGRSGQTLCGTV